jgi:peptidoglycan/LPS O-acetylase OafA/YrhL
MGSGCLLLGIALGQRHFIPDVDGSSMHAAVDGSLVLTIGIAGLAVFFASSIASAVSAAESSRFRRLVENNSLCAIGKCSYGMYVFHSLILVATVRSFPTHSDLPLFIAKPIAVIWVLAAGFGSAWLSYNLYEKHFLRLKQSFEFQKPARGSMSLAPEQSSRQPIESTPGATARRGTPLALLRAR